MISSKSRINSTAVLWIIGVTSSTLLIYQWISFSNTRQRLTNALCESQKQRDNLKFDLSLLQKKNIEQKQIITSVSKERDIALTGLYQEKQRAYVEAQGLRAKVSKLEASINQAVNILQSENNRLGKELASAQEELRLWEGKIKDLSERELVLKKVAATRKTLAQRTWTIRTSSRKALCYTKLVAGNSGYIVKSGKSTLNAGAAVELGKIIVEKVRK